MPMSWLREFQSECEYLDALWTAHQDGDCQEFVKYGTCQYCDEERERQQWEEKQKDRVDRCSGCGMVLKEEWNSICPRCR
jgi:hypothetical protein